MQGNVMLEIANISVHNGTVPVLKGVALEVGSREVVCVIGANGAGKSTLLKAISGLLPVKQGKVLLNGQDISALAPHRRARIGICQVPEGRGLFPKLSVMDNLLLGGYCPAGKRERGAIERDIEHVFEVFPILKERRRQLAGTMSGGEQQMLALARAFIAQPKILLLDEPSLGLSPLLVQTIFQIIRDLSQGGIPILLVEQNAKAALGVSQRGYVLESGRIVAFGPCDELAEDGAIRAAYLGAKSPDPPAPSSSRRRSGTAKRVG